MPYTKAQYVELALVQAYRDPKEETRVIELYADAYLTAAVNFLITKQYYIDMQADGMGKDISGLFFAVYEDVPVLYNESRGLYYVNMPQKMLALPNDRGLPYIGPMKGEQHQFPLIGQSTYHNIAHVMDFINGTFAQVEGDKILLHRLPAIVDKVLVKMIISVSDLEGTDAVPVPAGMEKDLIDLLADFMLGRRKLPQDNRNDNREE